MKNAINKKSKTADSAVQHVRDYGNEPYFVKKTHKSKAFLEKHGFPTELMEKKRLQM